MFHVSLCIYNMDFDSYSMTGTLFRASQFLSEELPIRLAHRVQELGDLPDGLNEMPSIKKVQDWYAQSFEVYSPSVPSFYSLSSNTVSLGNHTIVETNIIKGDS